MRDTLSKIKSRHYTRSSSFKMALLFTVLCGVCVLILGYFSYYFTRGHFIHGTEAVIDTEIQNASYIKKTSDFVKFLNEAMPVRGRIFLLLDKEGHKIAGNLSALLQSVSLLTEGVILLRPDKDKEFAAKIHTFADGSRLLIGVDITDIKNNFSLMQMLSMVMIILMLMIIAVSYAISSFVVSRTNRIAHTARNIMTTGDLSERIKIDSRWDDLSYVGTVLNEFLDRTQGLMGGIREVSDNIAHDLRTPLTRMRNNLEHARKDCADVVTSDQLDHLLGEVDQVLNTFNAILRISRIETGRQRYDMKPTDLSELIRDVFEFYEPLAEEKYIILQYDTDKIDYHCDRDLLFQAISNLLDNAIKFTPSGGTIKISLKRHENTALIMISDTGPGVSDADKPKIFQRFFRAETSRNMAGNGLGLSLVAAVINLHGGEITLRDNHPQGLIVQITLPKITGM